MTRRFVKVNGRWRRVREVRTTAVRLSRNEVALLIELCRADATADPIYNRPLTIIPKLDRALARFNKKGR